MHCHCVWKGSEEQVGTHQPLEEVTAAPLEGMPEGFTLPHFWFEVKKGRIVLTESQHHPEKKAKNSFPLKSWFVLLAQLFIYIKHTGYVTVRGRKFLPWGFSVYDAVRKKIPPSTENEENEYLRF